MKLPLVPASAANLPNGKVLFWSANDRFSFGAGGQAYTALFDPNTGTSTESLVNHTGQDMFCPGTSNLADGRILVSGGSDAAKTSIYNPATGAWSVAAQMNIPRAYQANTVLRDGSVFTLGGSWAGGLGNKRPEIWTEAGGWRNLGGIATEPFLTSDPRGVYRSDNHMWLIPAGNGQVFHAGPSVNMNWIETAGAGSSRTAGLRGDDVASMSGNAVMYDIGKVLKVGGSPAYQDVNATSGSYAIDIAAGVKVRKLAPMAYARAFHNSVVLPNGQVMVLGGQSFPVPFSDNTSVLAPELWDPTTETFTILAPMAVPRNYHSVALLLPDARVLSAGGGLCGVGCTANHPDAQIFTPHYLFNADGSPAARPALLSAPATAVYGTTLAVTTDSAVTEFALVRLASTTHTVNNDQRRIPLTFQSTGVNSYALAVPTNPGWAIPGDYMLFAMNAQGVPSVAKFIRVASTGTPRLDPIAEQVATAGGASFAVSPVTSGATSFKATGLPAGLSINASTGVVSGVATTAGVYTVSVFATNAAGTVSTDFRMQVLPAGAVRFVKLEEVSEINGNAWASMAEINLLDSAGSVISRSGWKVSADSEELTAGSGAASNAIDGDPTTIWHTQWMTANPRPPHHFIIDMGAPQRLSALRYLPRPGGTNGTIAEFKVYVSADGVSWGTPIATGDFRTQAGGNAALKTVVLSTGTVVPNAAPTISPPGDQSSVVGQKATLNVVATDDQATPLTYAATGLPAGLVINAASGIISGTPTAAGTQTVTLRVTDAQGAFAVQSFVWSVSAGAVNVTSVAAPVLSVGAPSAYVVSTTGAPAGTQYSWDYGDGSAPTAYASTPASAHAFAAPGLYNVTLTVKSPTGQLTVYRFTQAVVGTGTKSQAVASSSVLFEPASSSYGARIWAVNADAGTVSVLDAATLAKLTEIPVGQSPRTLTLLTSAGGTRQVWVANRGSATVSVIDASTRAIAKTLAMPAASQPYGVAASPKGDFVYVVLEATGRLLKLNPAGTVLNNVDVGTNSRHVSVSPDGTMLLVSRFISPPLPGEGTANVQTTALTGGEVRVVTAATMAVRAQPIVLQHSEKADSTVQGRGIPNYLGAAAVSPDGLSAWLPSKQDNIKRGLQRDKQALDFQNTVRAISSRIDMRTLAEDHPARVDHDNSGVASAAVYHPTGAYVFVALEASRHVAVMDPVGKRELFRVDAGRAPQGLMVSADGTRLFVSNFMDRTVAAYDLAPLTQKGLLELPVVATTRTVATETLPANVLLGKQLFYDARDTRLARDGYMSCAACHNDGGHDGRTWDLTAQGEGLRNTISLLGRAAGHGALHWSGNFDELQDFEGQIRALAGGTGLMDSMVFNTGTRNQPLGDAKAGLSADLDALAAYVKSLNTFAPSPYRNYGVRESLTRAGSLGRVVFTAQCATCHGGANFTQSALGSLRDVGTLKATSGKRLSGELAGIDIPTLRDAWATAPYLHDGSAATIEDAIKAHTVLTLTATDLANVASFVREIGGTEPALNVTPTGRYVKFEALSEVNGNPWSSMAEFDLLNPAGAALSRTGWKFETDSQELQGENGAVANAFDGNPNTIWHTQWKLANPAPPHQVVIDMGAAQSFTGFRYTPRALGGNGTVRRYRLFVSNDKLNWGVPVAQGDLLQVGPAAAVKSVVFIRP